MRRENKSKLLRRLSRAYPDARSELNFSSPYQLMIAVMLSAQCTDKMVNLVTPALFERYPDFEALARARTAQLEKIIRPINYYRTKAKNLIGAARMIKERFAGEIPRTHAQLIECPGVGRKTANVILGELGHEKTLPVDTHVYRVARRLGLAAGKDPHEVEIELRQEFDRRHWRKLHHWLILHGRRVCSARKPKCGECVLQEICPSAFAGSVLSNRK